jgi:uncharacterized protein (DUF427 family)
MSKASQLIAEHAETAKRLNALAHGLASNPPTKIETPARRVRVLFNKKIIADSSAARFVWEQPYYPTYYLPFADVQTRFIEKVQKTETGEAHICRLIVGDRGSGNVLLFDKGILSGLLRIEFDDMGI